MSSPLFAMGFNLACYFLVFRGIMLDCLCALVSVTSGREKNWKFDFFWPITQHPLQRTQGVDCIGKGVLSFQRLRSKALGPSSGYDQRR